MPRASKEKPQLQCGYLFQMNELQRKLKEKTKQMMALVAELSMKQALAIKLQQEMRHKEQFLMTVSSRIDQGLPPPKETEMEWLKVLRNEKMQKDAAEARAKVSFCHMLPLDLQPHLSLWSSLSFCKHKITSHWNKDFPPNIEGICVSTFWDNRWYSHQWSAAFHLTPGLHKSWSVGSGKRSSAPSTYQMQWTSDQKYHDRVLGMTGGGQHSKRCFKFYTVGYNSSLAEAISGPWAESTQRMKTK